MKLYILIGLILIGSAGCATNAHLYEDMLPNQHWSIWIYDNTFTCNGWFEKYETKEREEKEKKEGKKYTFFEKLTETHDHSEKKCIELFKEYSVKERAKELCQNDNYIIYGCLNSAENSGSGFHIEKSYENENAKRLRCYVDCNKHK